MKFILSLAFTMQSMGAWAMGAAPNSNPNAPPAPAWVQWVPIAVMVAVFYLLLIRPQSKQRKERENMLNNVKKGDRVVTNGGFVVTVVNVSADTLDVKLNDETKAKLRRSGVAEVLPESTVVEATVVGS
jgi:preprotein translocase subunit YajC